MYQASLRWHYPNQVLGRRSHLPLSMYYKLPFIKFISIISLFKKLFNSLRKIIFFILNQNRKVISKNPRSYERGFLAPRVGLDTCDIMINSSCALPSCGGVQILIWFTTPMRKHPKSLIWPMLTAC